MLQTEWLEAHSTSIRDMSVRTAIGAAIALMLLSAASAAADANPTVRVRVLVDQPEVTISNAKGRSIRIVAGPDQLRVAGSPSGTRYQTEGKGPYWVKSRSGATLNVRGQIRVDNRPGGLLVVNEVSLENYVVGTISAEMYSSWEPAAQRAQAVACRSYVLYQMAERAGEDFDVTDDVSSQRYLGIRGESQAGWAALRATTGEIISYDGRPALAAFHSASGGETASSEEVWGTSIPYLRSISVPNEDDSPDTYWRVAVSDAHMVRGLAQLGRKIGSVEEVEVQQRSGSGRADKLRFRGADGRATVTGREIRQMLGSTTLKSTLFDVRREAGHVVFVGSGNGHGVGMSQWAAQAMAQQGVGYREILSTFYPGTKLVAVEDLGLRFANRVETSSRIETPKLARNDQGEFKGDPAR